MSRILLPTCIAIALFFSFSMSAAPTWAADGGHAEAGSHDGHETGLPLNFKADLAIWSLVVFGLFVFILKKVAWGPLVDGLDKREATLRQAAAESAYAVEKSQSLLAEHQKKLDSATDDVREIIAEAKRDAERTKNDIVETARKEAEATKQRAVDDIGHAKDVAMKELFDSVSGQVTTATERVIGRSVSGDDHNRLIEEALAQFDQSH